MQTRWLSLLPVLPFVVLTAACTATTDMPADDSEDDDIHNISEDAANEPIPGLDLDADQADSEDSGEPESDSSEDAITVSGGTCVNGGSYCGGDKVTGDKNTLYLCHGKTKAPTVIKHCTYGCKVNSGVDDSCAPAPSTCSITKPPHTSYLKWGLHPDASDALKYLKVSSGRIMQTIGGAAASAGTHAQDGVVGGHAYSAATDISASGMTDAQVKVFIKQLTSVGFAAYYRSPGHDGWPSSEARHIHAIWVGAKMKLSLRNQVRDWRVNKNALASHTTYKFYTWSSCWHSTLWNSYLKSNSASN
jgi:hypothetical protein